MLVSNSSGSLSSSTGEENLALHHQEKTLAQTDVFLYLSRTPLMVVMLIVEVCCPFHDHHPHLLPPVAQLYTLAGLKP